jgi:hypothetical protein
VLDSLKSPHATKRRGRQLGRPLPAMPFGLVRKVGKVPPLTGRFFKVMLGTRIMRGLRLSRTGGGILTIFVGLGWHLQTR